MHFIKKNILCIAFAAIAVQALPAKTLSSAPDTLGKFDAEMLGFETRPGYVLPTKAFFRGENAMGKPIRNALSAHLRYSFKFSGNTRLGRLYPGAYQGIGMSYDSFSDANEIGRPVAIYLFQGAPFAHLGQDMTFGYEWNFGASFGWKKYDAETNPFNDVVGSYINAYIDLGLTFHWQFSSNWNLVAGIDITHYSNGNTNYPNYGVNLVGGKLGIARSFGAVSGYQAGKSQSRHSETLKPYLSCDIVLYGSTKRKGINWPDASYLVPGSFGIAGMNINPMWGFNKYFKAGASVDAQYDESANIKDHLAGTAHSGDLKFYRPPFREQFAVGISARAELTMPLFSVNMGIGRNVIFKGEDTDCYYQILALKVSVTNNAFIHIGYQLSSFHKPNNLMIGLGYRFR